MIAAIRGRRATTHWAYHGLLSLFGAIPVAERVVVDGSLVTAGGVTAGIDFALRIAAELAGREAAERIALELEYDPDPPFGRGHPSVADPAVVGRMREGLAERLAARRDAISRAIGS